MILKGYLHGSLSKQQAAPRIRTLGLDSCTIQLPRWAPEFTCVSHRLELSASLLLHSMTKTQQDSKPKKAQIPRSDGVGFLLCWVFRCVWRMSKTLTYPRTFIMAKESGVSVSQLWYRGIVPVSFGRFLPWDITIWFIITPMKKIKKTFFFCHWCLDDKSL